MIGSETTIARDNPAAARRWTKSIDNICENLAVQPNLGQTLQTKYRGEVRRHVSGNYLVYYRSVDEGVSILRIIQGAREQD